MSNTELIEITVTEITLSLRGGKRVIMCVRDIEHAAEAFCRWRDRANLGSSDLGMGCGNVRINGKLVAHVSYNGRIWPIE